MQTQVDLPKTPIDQVIDRIFSTRRITRDDQTRFMQALLSKSTLTESEQSQINRVFDALRSGLIKVVD